MKYSMILAGLLASPIFAQATPAPSALMSFAPFVLIAVVFYFFLIRPKMKEYKVHQEMVSSLAKKDTVMTAGGILGKITKLVDEDKAEVEIASGVTVIVLRATLTKRDA